ncbi:MAG: DUF58 domain-containing protein [Proteobacteria bacterium]|nr:DUF58 domain-containing protein [Pseudomonadota bacterium]
MKHSIAYLAYDDPIERRSSMRSSLSIGGSHRQLLASSSSQADFTRPYSFGDTMKTVDFRVLARTDEWVVRHVHHPTEQPYVMIMDCTDSMFWPHKQLRQAYRIADPTKHHIALRVLWNVAYHIVSYGRPVRVILILKQDSDEKKASSWQVHCGSVTFMEFSLIHSRDIADLYSLSCKNKDASMAMTLKSLGYCLEVQESPLNGLDKEAVVASLMDRYRHMPKLFISDLLHPFCRQFIDSLNCNVIHILSRLDMDLSWLRRSGYFKSHSKAKEGVTEDYLKKYYSKFLGRWLKGLKEKHNHIHGDKITAFGEQRENYCFLPSHTTLEEYAEKMGEVL